MVNLTVSKGYVQPEDVTTWFFRLQIIKSEITGIQRELITPRRVRRGLFNFVGDIASSMFGVATAQDFDRLAKIVESTQRLTPGIIHFSRELASSVRHAYDEVETHRDRINELSSSVFNITQEVSEVTKNLTSIQKHWRRTFLLMQFFQQLGAFELSIRLHTTAHLRYKRQRAAVDVGRLTNELFPLSQFKRIRELLPPEVRLVPTNRWYYHNVIVRPLRHEISESEELHYIYVASHREWCLC